MRKISLLLRAIGGRSKENIAVFSILMIVFILMLIGGTVWSGIEKSVIKLTVNNIDARTLLVANPENTQEDNIALLASLAHIEKVFPQEERLFAKTIALTDHSSADCYFVGVDEDLMLPALYGSQLSLQQNEIMIPEVLYTSSGETIQGKDLLGKEWSIEVTVPYFVATGSGAAVDNDRTVVHSQNYRIVGVYDAGNNYCRTNQVLLSFDQVAALQRLSQGNWNELAAIDDRFIIDETLAVLVDDLAQVPTTIYALEQMNFSVTEAFSLRMEVINLIKILAVGLKGISIILGVLLLGFLQLRMIQKRQQLIGLWRVVGYTPIQIAALMSLQTFLVAIPAFLIALAICKILYDKVLSEMLFEHLSLAIFSPSFILSHIVLALIVLFVTLLLAIHRLQRLTPSESIKEVV